MSGDKLVKEDALGVKSNDDKTKEISKELRVKAVLKPYLGQVLHGDVFATILKEINKILEA